MTLMKRLLSKLKELTMNKINTTDLSGQKFGLLTLEELIIPSPYRKKAYRCICDCGNTCVRLESSLKNKKHTSSCGCISKKYLTKGDSKRCSNAGKCRKNSFVNGSNIQMTFREGTIKGNTSGTQGVSWSNSAHKWHVYIGYQNYRANLGYFEDMNLAILVRKQAEEAIRNGTFEEFFYEMRGYHLGEKNNKQFKKH